MSAANSFERIAGKLTLKVCLLTRLALSREQRRRQLDGDDSSWLAGWLDRMLVNGVDDGSSPEAKEPRELTGQTNEGLIKAPTGDLRETMARGMVVVRIQGYREDEWSLAGREKRTAGIQER